MVDEAEILHKLVVEEKDVMKEIEQMVEKASNYFKIEKPGGKIIFKDFGGLNDKQRIIILLLGKYFAAKLKIIGDPSMSISTVAKELGRPVTTLSGNMKDLVTKGYAEYIPNGKKYRVSYHRIHEIFETLLDKRKAKGGH